MLSVAVAVAVAIYDDDDDDACLRGIFVPLSCCDSCPKIDKYIILDYIRFERFDSFYRILLPLKQLKMTNGSQKPQ